MIFKTLEELTIIHWDEKGLYQSATNEKQTLKLVEESLEVDNAFTSEGVDEQKKEIGDVITVIINLCKKNGFTLEECLQLAYEKNKNRDGKMSDGEFIHKK